ncbi:MAG: hypothetical protein WA751_00875 [Candidatus Dormiibacterota bacterium]
MKGQNVPGVLFLFACGVGVLVVDVLINIVFGGAPWGVPIAELAGVAIMLGIMRLALGRLPLRPWLLRRLGREK